MMEHRYLFQTKDSIENYQTSQDIQETLLRFKIKNSDTNMVTAW